MNAVYIIIHDHPQTKEVADKLQAYKSKHANLADLNGLVFAIGSDYVPEQVHFALRAVFDKERYVVVPVNGRLRGNAPPSLDTLIESILQF